MSSGGFEPCNNCKSTIEPELEDSFNGEEYSFNYCCSVCSARPYWAWETPEIAKEQWNKTRGWLRDHE